MQTRRLALSCIAGLINLNPVFAAAPSCDPDHQPQVIDPVFKLNEPESFYARHFQPVPLSILKSCQLVAKHGDYEYRYWQLATAQSGAISYTIFGGSVLDNTAGPDRADQQRGTWVANHFGSLEAITGGTCKTISWPIDVFCTAGSGSPPEPVLRALADNFVRRYDKAFGSHSAFVAELKRQHRLPVDPALHILSQAVSQPQP